MALEQKLSLKLAQKLVMTHSLQQAIKLLQLSRIELEETLSEEILENPMLEVEEQEEQAPHLEVERAADVDIEPINTSEASSALSSTSGDEPEMPSPEEAYNDIDVEAFFSDYLGDARTEGPSITSYTPGNEVPLENVVSAPSGLYDHLVWQLHMMSCPSKLVEACEFIIGNIDEDGFLRANDEEICNACGVHGETVVQALTIVKSFDPPGVGSRSLQECLAAQVDVLIVEVADEDEADLLERVRQVLCEQWDNLLHQRWEPLAAAIGCKIADMRSIIDVIHRLEPKPGRKYQPDRNAYIEPDVYIRKIDGEYDIVLNDDGLPRLRINSRYKQMLEGRAFDSQVTGYLREKMRNAMWLMKSIDQRQRTIFKVARSIVDFQKDFLDSGIEHLKPMVLRQVAEDIGMHESTISRVVSNKYMYTPRGLFPMKFFFHSGVDSARGDNISSLVVKERIKKLIEGEDPVRPLSDSKIMRMLQREGVRLARRTVAKYREEMMIPSSDKRKKLF